MPIFMRELLIQAYIIGTVVGWCWAISNYFKVGEDNSIKTLKYITWGRLLYSIIFPGGLILFYLCAILVFLVGLLVELFDGKHPFAFFKKQVFK